MISSGRNRKIPIIVRVSGELKYLSCNLFFLIKHYFFQSDVNDNAPVFVNTPYEVTVPEVS